MNHEDPDRNQADIWLECLCELAETCSQRDAGLEESVSESAAIIRKAFSEREPSFVRIVVPGIDVLSGVISVPQEIFSFQIPLYGVKQGMIEAGYGYSTHSADAYSTSDSSSINAGIEPSLEKFMKTAAVILAGAVNFRQALDRLGRASRAVKRKNLALREVLYLVEFEKNELKKQISNNIERFIIPVASTLSKSRLTEEERNLLTALVSQARDITSSFGKQISEAHLNLSQREIEISGLIRGGMSTKDIAAILNLSQLTVERHRHNIRKKLNIDGKDVNLSTFLKQDSY